jgi:hypothetical protein
VIDKNSGDLPLPTLSSDVVSRNRLAGAANLARAHASSLSLFGIGKEKDPSRFRQVRHDWDFVGKSDTTGTSTGTLCPMDFASSSFLIIGFKSPALSATLAIFYLVNYRVVLIVEDPH